MKVLDCWKSIGSTLKSHEYVSNMNKWIELKKHDWERKIENRWRDSRTNYLGERISRGDFGLVYNYSQRYFWNII